MNLFYSRKNNECSSINFRETSSKIVEEDVRYIPRKAFRVLTPSSERKDSTSE
jgi:hypothetical protein